MKTIVPTAIALICAALAGCAAPPTQVREQARNEFRDIHAGESTREDILKLLGKPEQISVFERVAEEVWDYRYQEVRHMVVSVHFSTATGRVKYYTNILDPAFENNNLGSDR